MKVRVIPRSLLLPSTKIKTQRCVREMRVIILWPGTDQRAFVVVVILIPKIPIHPPVDLYRQPGFGGLKVHRIGIDQSAGRSGWVRQPAALAVVLIHAISGKQGHTRSEPGGRINVEEIVSQEVETMTERMSDAVVEVIDYGVTICPVVVVTGTK